MRWFKDLSIFAKLMTGFGLLGAILAATGWLGIRHLDTAQANTEAVYKNELVPLVALGDIQDDLQRLRQDTYRMFGSSTPAEVRAIVDHARQLDRDLVERSDRYLLTIVSEAERVPFQRFQESMRRYRTHREENH